MVFGQVIFHLISTHLKVNQPYFTLYICLDALIHKTTLTIFMFNVIIFIFGQNKNFNIDYLKNPF